MWEIREGDCLDVMAAMEPESFDAIVTDPPYGLGFMGKDWDHGVPGAHFWQEALRVAKPGAHLLAFGGTRTFHRLTCAIEDAGWEIRDCIMWVYGSGFPKSLNLGNGWGTALKPAWEPIIVARKPLAGTVAANVQKYGTGALNIDGCRVPGNYETRDRDPAGGSSMFGLGKGGGAFVPASGRWPANLIHDGSEEVTALFPGDGDESAARFFYCAKASRADREEGCEGLEQKSAGECTDRNDGTAGLNSPRAGAGRTSGHRNHHPTVKPTALMRYLCRLVTPPAGTVLDPFAGSGSTGKAALLESFHFTGIELNPTYATIARNRLQSIQSATDHQAYPTLPF